MAFADDVFNSTDVLNLWDSVNILTGPPFNADAPDGDGVIFLIDPTNAFSFMTVSHTSGVPDSWASGETVTKYWFDDHSNPEAKSKFKICRGFVLGGIFGDDPGGGPYVPGNECIIHGGTSSDPRVLDPLGIGPINRQYKPILAEDIGAATYNNNFRPIEMLALQAFSGSGHIVDWFQPGFETADPNAQMWASPNTGSVSYSRFRNRKGYIPRVCVGFDIF